MPALEYLRAEKVDCDDILAISHYALGSGEGILFKGKMIDHVVYLYSEDGKYGFISQNKNENTEPIYQTKEEAIIFFARNLAPLKYGSYNEIILPEEKNSLLYDLNYKDDVLKGPEVRITFEK